MISAVLILAWSSVISLFGFIVIIVWTCFRLPGHAYLEHIFELYPQEKKGG